MNHGRTFRMRQIRAEDMVASDRLYQFGRQCPLLQEPSAYRSVIQPGGQHAGLLFSFEEQHVRPHHPEQNLLVFGIQRLVQYYLAQIVQQPNGHQFLGIGQL